jgi:P27 family predicted phage terminase small subunit
MIEVKAPAHLAKPTRAYWQSVVSANDLEPHRVRLLTLACEAWDRTVEARELIARDGMVVAGREGGMRPHPAIAIERDSRLAFVRIMRELGLRVAGAVRYGPGRPATPLGWLGPDA